MFNFKFIEELVELVAGPVLVVVPSDGVFTRRHTADCAFCTVFYSVFCFSTMLPWGGRGRAGTTVSSSDVFCLCPFALVFTVFFALSRSCFFAPSAFSLGFYSVLRLHDVAHATLHIGVGGVGWGNHAHVNLILHHVADATLHIGVGWGGGGC